MCGDSEDQELKVHLQVPKRAGQPGSGVVPDSCSQGPPGVMIRYLCPGALLLSAGKGAQSISTHSVAK